MDLKFEDKCAKCGRNDNPDWLLASVDLMATLCVLCIDEFDEWCETHPGEPYDNFLHPKPWKPNRPGLIIAETEDGNPATFAFMPIYERKGAGAS